jgi:hypothetical protein
MPNEEFSLDRELNIQRNIDATGKKWQVVTERGRHFFLARPEGARPDSIIPEILQGKFTKKMYIEEAIKKHVADSWAHADAVDRKNERKREAAREQAKNGRKETKEPSKED